MDKLSTILNGWKNVVLGITTEEAIRRSEICADCPHAAFSMWVEQIVGKDEKIGMSGYKCGLCGCPISAKVRAKESVCPAGKWAEKDVDTRFLNGDKMFVGDRERYPDTDENISQ